MKTLLYKSSILLYNKSHIPAVIEYSRTNDKDLGTAAHEVLKEVSTQRPDVFRSHVQELCKSLEAEAPSINKINAPGAVEDLKACASFANKFPNEVPKGRKFVESLKAFALYGSPPKAAKYAITILMSSANRKEMLAKDLIDSCTADFKYGSGNFITRLAALSQLAFVGPTDMEDERDTIMDIVINQVFNQTDIDSDDTDWVDEPNDHLAARLWALRILVNLVRRYNGEEATKSHAEAVYKTLKQILANGGSISLKHRLPASYESWLRLSAAKLILKMSSNPHLDRLLTLRAFEKLALVAQDPITQVRERFVKTTIKYLTQQRVGPRFYTILFLLAFDQGYVKEFAAKFIRARCIQLASQKDTTMEAVFCRLLSLLAHHPDFADDANSPDGFVNAGNLADFVRYITFYLQSVANSENLGMIYHVAQRVKNVKDGMDPEKSDNLYVLSDLSQAVIRQYEDAHGWSMQAWPGKFKLPAGLFTPLPSHDAAQQIATKQFIPADLVDDIDGIVKSLLKSKKVGYLQ
jgi:sister chromatid cohesion protein PDS5